MEYVKAVQLSRREREVLRLLALGRSVPQVAGELGISINTVRVYVRTMRQKLKASNIPHAVAQAFSKGVLDENTLICPEDGVVDIARARGRFLHRRGVSTR